MIDKFQIHKKVYSELGEHFKGKIIENIYIYKGEIKLFQASIYKNVEKYYHKFKNTIALGNLLVEYYA